MGSDNDADDDQLFESGFAHEHYFPGNPRHSRLTIALMSWIADTQVGRRLGQLKLALFRWRTAPDDPPEPASQTPAGDPAPVSRSPSPSVASLVAQELTEMKTFCDRNGCVLAVTWANHGPSYEWLQNWASENDVLFCDWQRSADSVQNCMPRLPHDNTHSGGHFRTWVNRLIADRFAQLVLTSAREQDPDPDASPPADGTSER